MTLLWNNICKPYKPRQVFDDIINACRKDNKSISRLLIWGSRWKGSQMPKEVYQMSLAWCRQVGQLQSVTVEWTITGEMKLGKVDCTEANCYALVVVMKQGWLEGRFCYCLWATPVATLTWGQPGWVWVTVHSQMRFEVVSTTPPKPLSTTPDLPQSQFLSNIFGIHGYPTLLIISEGKMWAHRIGAVCTGWTEKMGGWKKCVKCMCLAHSNLAQFFMGRPRNVKRRDLKHQWSCSWWRRQRYSFSGRRSRLLKGLSTDTAWQCNILHSSCACTVFRRILLWEYEYNVSFCNHLGTIVGTFTLSHLRQSCRSSSGQVREMECNNVLPCGTWGPETLLEWAQGGRERMLVQLFGKGIVLTTFMTWFAASEA